MLIVIIFIAILIAGSAIGYLLLVGVSNTTPHSTFQLSSPIYHKPTFLGSHDFILGSGVILQNGSAYSYVWINASALKSGDSFVALPALNVGLSDGNENNLTGLCSFTGSGFDDTPYWINFTTSILGTRANISQIGIESTFSRVSTPLQGFHNAFFYSQISNVVGETGEFEYFFYVGNSTTPVPVLSHGPVS